MPYQVSFNCFCQYLNQNPFNIITALIQTAFLGNKYGYRPFPAHIEAKEFDLLINTLKSQADMYVIFAYLQKTSLIIFIEIY